MKPLLSLEDLRAKDFTSSTLCTQYVEKLVHEALNAGLKFTYYISTDMFLNRIFICSMQYNKILFIPSLSQDQEQQTQEMASEGSLYYVRESVQVSSCDSSPIFDTMRNLLHCVFDNVVVPRARIEQQKLLDSFLGQNHNQQQERSIEQTLMTRFECIASVALQHLYFQDNCLHGISLQQQKDNRSHSEQASASLQSLKKSNGQLKFNFRNYYHNNNEFKIDDFNFQLLFKKIPNFDVILQLIRSLLLEKKIIMIENDTSDMAIIMQTLITLI